MITTELESAIEAIGVRDAGKMDSERLLFRCKQDINLGGILILAGKLATEKSMAPSNDSVFWFPDIEVKEGEYIRLYTRSGEDRKTTGSYGETPAVYYNFYWKKSLPVWTEDKNAYAILTIAEWNLHKVGTNYIEPVTPP